MDGGEEVRYSVRRDCSYSCTLDSQKFNFNTDKTIISIECRFWSDAESSPIPLQTACKKRAAATCHMQATEYLDCRVFLSQLVSYHVHAEESRETPITCNVKTLLLFALCNSRERPLQNPSIQG